MTCTSGCCWSLFFWLAPGWGLFCLRWRLFCVGETELDFLLRWWWCGFSWWWWWWLFADPTKSRSIVSRGEMEVDFCFDLRSLRFFWSALYIKRSKNEKFIYYYSRAPIRAKIKQCHFGESRFFVMGHPKYALTFGAGQKNNQCHGTVALVRMAPLNHGF